MTALPISVMAFLLAVACKGEVASRNLSTSKSQDPNPNPPPGESGVPFLTCESVGYKDIAATSIEFGCLAYGKDRKKLDISALVSTWTISSSSDEVLNVEVIQNENYQRTWKIPISSFQKALKVTLKLPHATLTENLSDHRACSQTSTQSGSVKFCTSVSTPISFDDYIPSSNYSDLSIETYSIDSNGRCVDRVNAVPFVSKEKGLVTMGFVPYDNFEFREGQLYCFALKLPTTDPSFSPVIRTVPVP